MGTAGYILILLACLLWGTLAGWRKGLLGQTGSLLGICFGAVGSRILLPDFMPVVAGWLGKSDSIIDPQYMVASVASLIIVAVAYGFFLLCGLVLNRLLKILAVEPIDSVLGALFGLAKWCFLISVAYNAILGVKQEGALLDLCKSGDGNPVELVMWMAPAAICYDSPDELIHLQQLEEARKISAVPGQQKRTAECYHICAYITEIS